MDRSVNTGRWNKPTAAQVTAPVGTAPPVVAWSAMVPPTPLRYTGTTVQAVQRALQKAFGNFPIRLNREAHIEVLRGMCAVAEGSAEPYHMLFTALERFGEIEVRDKL